MIGTFNSGRSGRCAPADWHEQEEQEQDELCCWAVGTPPLAHMCCWFHTWLLIQVLQYLQVATLAGPAFCPLRQQQQAGFVWAAQQQAAVYIVRYTWSP